MSKQNWIDYYYVDTSLLVSYQSNQYVPKSSISSSYILLSSSNFQTEITTIGLTIRWYYLQNTISPYTGLVYSAYDTRQCNLAYNNFAGTSDLIVSRNTSGDQVPYRYGTTYPADQWPLVHAVIYNSSNGLYKRYNISEILNGAVIDSTYQSGLPYLYRLTYSATISGWPTTL